MSFPDPTQSLWPKLSLPLSDGTVWTLGLSLLALVVVADLLTPASMVIGTLLTAPVAITALGASKRPISVLTGLGVLGNIVAGTANAWQYNETPSDLINRSVSILAVLLVGVLTYRAREASERAARLAAEERQLSREQALRSLLQEMGGPLGQAEFVQRAALALQHLTGASSVEIGAVDRATLRPPYALALAPDLSEQDHPSRLHQRLPLEFLTHSGGDLYEQRIYLARLRRHADSDLLVLVSSPKTSAALTREAMTALQPLLERTALLDDLRANQQQLAERGEVLRDLVYAFSHDLRTPLLANAMNMRAALRGAFGPLPEEYRHTLQNGLEANETLLALAQQLLLVAKYESGEEGDEEPQTVNLRELTLSVLGDLRERAQAQRITLDPHLEGVSVVGRRHDLRRAIQNLLDNAVKFSPPGGTVVVTLEGQGDEARLAVQDEGPGVPSERQARLFQRFRGGGAGSGTGLGLYLTRRIAQAHGGQVHYARNSRARSVFTLSLPVSEGGRVAS